MSLPRAASRTFARPAILRPSFSSLGLILDFVGSGNPYLSEMMAPSFRARSSRV